MLWWCVGCVEGCMYKSRGQEVGWPGWGGWGKVLGAGLKSAWRRRLDERT